MSKKNEKREIKKDQLLQEWGFLRFCNEDPANSYVGGRMEINEPFLRAAEKDNLIKPLFQENGQVRQTDGTIKDGVVNYYSPHQIYLLTELKDNVLTENGYLWGGEKAIGWMYGAGEPKKLRMVAWGKSWVNSESLGKAFSDEWSSVLEVSKNLHSFLELLHSLEPIPRHYGAEEKQRYWSNASILEYNFEPLKIGGKKLLKTYDLDEKKLIILRRNVGQIAEMTDPLAHWYYYIKRHPEWKKDLLKGDASLAQEIYRLYDLLTEVWEVVAKEKSEPIFEFLHKDFGAPFYAPKTEYLHGEDIKALKYAIEQFKKWKRKKDNKSFVNDEAAKKMADVEKELNEYEKRYGDRTYAGNVRWYHEEEKIKLEDLDEKTKWYVNNTLAQIKDAKVEHEIPRAIESRLGDLKRELRQIFWSISQQFSEKENTAWQEINSNNLWMKLAREGKFEGLDHAQQVQLANTERKKIEAVAKGWKEKSKEFGQTVSWFADLTFCKVCRAKPVRLHIENTSRNMWQVALSVICDDCFANINHNSLTADDEWWKNNNQAEWRCERCDKLLYKFAYGNMLSAKTLNNVPVKIEVAYGRATMKAKCPNPECGATNERFIDWGWLP